MRTLRLSKTEGPFMNTAELKDGLALTDLIRDLANAQEGRKKQFAAIVRFVRHREASGSAKDLMAQIRRDEKLCKLLVDYEDKSEIIGMMELIQARRVVQPCKPECGPCRATAGYAGYPLRWQPDDDGVHSWRTNEIRRLNGRPSFRP